MQGTNPRAARIAALIQRVIASNMESTLHDKRLKNVTITDVKVTNDLQLAKVYWTTISHTGNDEGERKRAQTALNQARGRLRTMVGAKAGLRLTPQLQFIFDEVPGEAHAQYAGEADPYKHDDEDETEDKIERLKHEDKDEYNEYDGDVVTVEELEDFDDDEDAVDGSDDDPVDPAELDPQSTIDGAQD